ncbi:Bor/Iss family lipoprotein [Psychrobacter sp. FDAARGOS_221]|uniref:Bor/Iss family lipoprotein n=1 Tax=Psychrobacter sp. FDAARGOS_221 TaxID=1975705 RepID=UPI000BB544B4|nr:Bor family protein [Psychrobacter sp. FDAARGOS_221]PNK60829.1 lipoprotein bor [Psychrobacter sp. FDAARGOS_221]
MLKKVATVAMLAFLTTGCATQTYLVSPEANTTITAQTSADDESMQTFFVNGLGQEQTIDAAEKCGGKDQVAGVQTKLTPLNWALGFISSGIYTPRQIRVFCK